MKKIISTILVTIMLLSGLVILTGCGNNGENKGENKTAKNTHEIVYDYTGTKVKAMVPNEASPAYEFTKEKPENKIYFSGSFYLVGEKIAMAFSSDKLFGDGVDNFDKFVDYLKSDKYTGTYKIKEEVTIGGRKALRLDFRNGSTSSDNLYGYQYLVSGDGVDDGRFYIISVTKADFTLGNIAETMGSDDVSAIINSIKFEK